MALEIWKLYILNIYTRVGFAAFDKIIMAIKYSYANATAF